MRWRLTPHHEKLLTTAGLGADRLHCAYEWLAQVEESGHINGISDKQESMRMIHNLYEDASKQERMFKAVLADL